MKKYVVGFAFSEDAQQVVLIRKNRPAWMAGKLNGIGGHIESGESPLQAMVREFAEETGVSTALGGWREFAIKQDELACVHVFACFNNSVLEAKSLTDEQVELCVVNDPALDARALHGTRHLLELALQRESVAVVTLDTSRPKEPA
jgi:8-oxo-dGTP diphosphatase